MDKIKRYNQVILAIAGTLAIVLCLGIGMVFLVDMSKQFGWGQQEPTGIPSDERAASRPKQEVPKDLVSFAQIEVIDSVAKVYCFPVMQAGSEDSGGGKTYFYPRPPLANNLLLHFGRTNELVSVFDDRIGITAFNAELISGEMWIFITATNFDSNRDGMLNTQDMQDLYVYRVSKRQLMQFPQEQGTFLGRLLTHDASSVYLRYGIDRDDNGWYDHSREPKYIFLANLLNGDCQPLVPQELADELQRRLEGRPLEEAVPTDEDSTGQEVPG